MAFPPRKDRRNLMEVADYIVGIRNRNFIIISA